jgi:hypothetical protein
MSGSPQEIHAPEMVHRVDIPLNLNQCGDWWSELKAVAEAQGVKVSYRAKRYSRDGPGWYTLSCNGPLGSSLLEEAIKRLYKARPDLDVDSIKLPEVADVFPTTAVASAIARVTEHILGLPQGIPELSLRLVDNQGLAVRVLSDQMDEVEHDVVVVRSDRANKIPVADAAGASASPQVVGVTATEPPKPQEVPLTAMAAQPETRPHVVASQSSPPQAAAGVTAAPSGIGPIGAALQTAIASLTQTRNSLKPTPIRLAPPSRQNRIAALPPFYKRSMQALVNLMSQQTLIPSAVRTWT